MQRSYRKRGGDRVCLLAVGLVCVALVACTKDIIDIPADGGTPDSIVTPDLEPDLPPPSPSYLVTGGAVGDEVIYDMALDKAGNLYLLGDVTGPVTLGKVKVATKGKVRIVAKLDPRGEFRWATPLVSHPLQYLPGRFAVTDNGEVWTSGNFTGTIQLGSDKLSSHGSTDIYIARLDPSGKVVWASSAGGKGDDRCHGIAADGKVAYVTGQFAGAAKFGDIAVTTPTSAGYVARIAQTGTFEWVAQSGDGPVGVKAAIVDADGNPRVTGYFFGGAIAFGSTTLTSGSGNMNSDWFVASLDRSNGKFLWAKQSLSQVNQGNGFDVVVAAGGASYVTGLLKESANTPGTPFIARRCSTGVGDWCMTPTCSGAAGSCGVGTAVSPHLAGGAYVAGHLYGNIVVEFGPDKVDTVGRKTDGFLAMVKSDGTWSWGIPIGGTGDDEVWALAQDNAGDLYVAGTFSGTGRFGNQTRKSVGGTDLFIWKIAGGKKPSS